VVASPGVRFFCAGSGLSSELPDDGGVLSAALERAGCTRPPVWVSADRVRRERSGLALRAA
jgi:hypothetical protein